jgi:hypothetical protein
MMTLCIATFLITFVAVGADTSTCEKRIAIWLRKIVPELSSKGCDLYHSTRGEWLVTFMGYIMLSRRTALHEHQCAPTFPSCAGVRANKLHELSKIYTNGRNVRCPLAFSFFQLKQMERFSAWARVASHLQI